MMDCSGPFLDSDVTIESPEFQRKPPSLHLSCRSSVISLKSEASDSAGDLTDSTSGCRQGSDSGTVVSCPNAVVASFPSAFTGHTPSIVSMDTSMEDVSSWGAQTMPPLTSRLDRVLDRVFVQASPKGDLQINHLACLTHVKSRVQEIVKDAKILAFNCQDPDPNFSRLFDKAVDCCFNLHVRPVLDNLIRFSEACFDWLAVGQSNVLLFHAESSTGVKRLLILLLAYASFCDSVERQNIKTNRRIRAYLSTYPNGNTCVPVVFLRYANYMKIFTPFRRQSISRATISVHNLVMLNSPLLSGNVAHVFFKFYSHSPLRHVYTTNVHEIDGQLGNQMILRFVDAPISLRGDVIIICYQWNPTHLERRRIFKLTFHSCESYQDLISFGYDEFDEVSQAVPATFKLDLHLIPATPKTTTIPFTKNCFTEDTSTTLAEDTCKASYDHLNPSNVIDDTKTSVTAARLADSLEDLDHLPNRRSFLADISDPREALDRHRQQTLNEFLHKKSSLVEVYRWPDFQVEMAQSRLSSGGAPPRPPPPKLHPHGCIPLGSLESGTQSERTSFDSGASVCSQRSDFSDTSENSQTKKLKKFPGLKKIKRKMKEAFGSTKALKFTRSSKDSASVELMPPPAITTVARMKSATTAVVSSQMNHTKSVAFLHSNPKVPPPRPPPPAPECLHRHSLLSRDYEMEESETLQLRKTPAGVRGVPTRYFGPLEKYRRVADHGFATIRGLNRQLPERSTPTIFEEREAEDFEEAEYRQLSCEGYDFTRSPVSHDMTATQDLDQLLEELCQTKIDYSSGSRLPMNGHSARSYNQNYHGGASADTGPGRYSGRSYSLTGGGGGLVAPRTSSLGSSSGNWSSYQRSQAISSERTQQSGRPSFERNNSYGYRTISHGDGSGAAGDGVFVRQTTPAPLTPSQQRFQSTYRTTLQHRPPISPKRFKQINLTIDPEFGKATANLTPEIQTTFLTPASSRYQGNSTARTLHTMDRTQGISYREQQLLQELSTTRDELAKLKRANSVVDEPFSHRPVTPSTLPSQRRTFMQQQQHHSHQENREMFVNRHQSQYQSHHDIQQGSSAFRPKTRSDSAFISSVPKRAMSTANVTSAQSSSWNYRNGVLSGQQSPAPAYSSIRGMHGNSMMLPKSQGYSARRERLRSEAEQAAQMQTRQSTQRMDHVAASSSDLRSSSAMHQQQQLRRQHYHSMSTIHPERTEFEEVETVSLQPIGRGVQDLDSTMGSTATLNRPRRPVASSMLEGLNRTDNYSSQRQHVNNFGRQNSNLDISQPMTARPHRAESHSFLSSLRRPTTTETYQMTTQQGYQQQSLHDNQYAGIKFAPQPPKLNTNTINHTAIVEQRHQGPSQPQQLQQHQMSTHKSSSISSGSYKLHETREVHQQIAHQTSWVQQQRQQQQQLTQDRQTLQNSADITPLTSVPVEFSMVEETSPIWYRLKISRQDAINMLKHQPSGSFLVRDSTSVKGAYGLAVKSTKSPNKPGQKSGFAKFMKNILTEDNELEKRQRRRKLQLNSRKLLVHCDVVVLQFPPQSGPLEPSHDITNDLVRHYLIEPVTNPTRGVRIKGFSAEPIFPDLLTLIHHHTQVPVALPCCLLLPQMPGVMRGLGLSLVGGNGLATVGGDSDSVTLVQSDANNGLRSMDGTPVSFQSVNVDGHDVPGGGNVLVGPGTLMAPQPLRTVTSPLSPTAGMFHTELATPPPNVACRCLYLGAVELDAAGHADDDEGVMRAVDALIPGPMLQATACDQLGANSPVQYTECHLQAAHNEGILLTDLSRKVFFQRHFSVNSFVHAGVDRRDKAFIHPNHSALGLEKPKLFGFIIKKPSGQFVGHIFSEFDANTNAAAITTHINSLFVLK